MKSKHLFILSMIVSQLLFWFYLLSKITFDNAWLGRLLIVLFSLSLTAAFFFYFITLSHMIHNSRTELQVKIMEHESIIKDKDKKRLEQMISEKNATKTLAIIQLRDLKKFISNQNPSQIQHHMESMAFSLQNKQPYYFCNNALLNAIFHEKQNIAKSQNISINYAISLPTQISVSQSELASLFFNLLDNAIEACNRSSNPNPSISLNVFFKDNILSIQMINSKNPKISFDKKTFKKDSITHGLGLSIVEDIVHSHHGHVSWIDQGDIFESVLMLNI